MRATWKGSISFGLVNIPVELYPATVSESRSAAHQVHQSDGGRIRYRRICELDGEEVPYAEIAKSYESSDGRQVVLTDEDMAELPLPSKKIVDVLAFVDEADIDPLALSKPYYLGPAGPTATKAYVLIREALAGQGRAAVTKITLSTRESLALVRAQGDVLTLQTMLWPDELRPPEGIAPRGEVTIRPQELKMAASLMDTLSEDFELSQVHDDYQRALDALVEAKAAGAHPDEAAGRTTTANNVVDLMSALTASVEAAAKGRPGAKRTMPKTTIKSSTKKGGAAAARSRRKTG
ncbi:Ku protein [Embleya sp. NPDC059237]|uniref:non-homologous end joining protein Ku n=1 Tax=Embleya sp. NPDC059237 TaxID=3346784 RepID=UPI0036768B8E